MNECVMFGYVNVIDYCGFINWEFFDGYIDCFDFYGGYLFLG